LMFAAIFGAALQGLDRHTPPPPPTEGNAYLVDASMPGLHTTWGDAIATLSDPALHAFFDPKLLQILAATKAQEMALFAKLSDHDALLATLEAV